MLAFVPGKGEGEGGVGDEVFGEEVEGVDFFGGEGEAVDDGFGAEAGEG